MEDWQIEHITKNLPKLSEQTVFNWNVKAELLANKILCKADVEKIDVDQHQNGNSYASYQCYQMLMGRTDAYKVVTNALLQTNQTGAARILIRVPVELCDKPLTYLGISTELEEFKDADIEVNGKTVKVHEFFPGANYEKLWQVFKDTVNELEIYDTFVTKQRTFVLSINTVPPKPPYYVPRFLSNRLKIDESVFKADCPDVFVFKNSISRYNLSEIARPHSTDTSVSQLTKITCRFIYLEENEDWDELKKIAKVPIHLINYEAFLEQKSDNKNDLEDSSDSDAITEDSWDSESDPGEPSRYKPGQRVQFILEDTSAPSEILKKIGTQNERIYMSEDDFVQEKLSEERTSSSFCICDSPGMGKTFLFANIARLMTENCNGRIIAFIKLATLSGDIFLDSTNTDLSPEATLLNVVKCVLLPRQNPDLLLKIIQANLIQMKMFFDGFDELPGNKVQWMTHVFRNITTNFPNVWIYITSRLHMRRGLETSLGVVAYDILPFNQQNQIDFLVQYWQTSKPGSDKVTLQSYAKCCLKAVHKSITQNDKKITGIPLLCQLTAEVYGNKKAFQSIKTGRFFDVPLQIFGMYRTFFQNKINLVTKNKDEFDNVLLVYIWHALKLLFPTNGYHKTNRFQKVKHMLISSKLLKAGILQKHSNGALEFVHRTFAEYLVAEYFYLKLQDKDTKKTEEMKPSSMSVLKLPLDCRRNWLGYYEFVHPVIVAFFNSALGEVNISEELKIQVASFISFIPNEEFLCILYACCHHCSLNIFSLMREALMKCDKSWILKCYTIENSCKLLLVCIRESTSQMFHACIQLLKEELKLDLEQINTFDRNNTLLRWAATYGNYEAVEYFADRVSLKNQSLLANCVKWKNSIEERKNILHLLLNKDQNLIHENPDILFTNKLDVNLFKILVNFGANLTAVDKYGNNCAMHFGHYLSPSDYHELVQFLLTDCKADYLFFDHEKWRDPLPKIIEYVTLLPETIELLLDIPGMDISMKDRWEESLFLSAVKANDMKHLLQLVEGGVNYNYRGKENRSLLHLAAQHGGVEIVRYLLSLKLDPNSRDNSELTPLHYATIHEKISVLDVLVENGADVQAKTNLGRTALYLVTLLSDSKCLEKVEYLIGKGAKVNDCDNDGNTPLHLCYQKEVRDCLIEMGADVHAKNKKGQTALHMYVEQFDNIFDKEAAQYLIRNGFGVNDRDNDGNTPLHLCYTMKAKECLIEMGADIHGKNNEGKTPAQINPHLWKSST